MKTFDVAGAGKVGDLSAGFRRNALPRMGHGLSPDQDTPQVRDRLGLRSTISSRFRMRLTQSVLPKVFPVFPRRLRFYPEYLRALDLGAM
jgi:uncharacterized protein (DUF2236 family)